MIRTDPTNPHHYFSLATLYEDSGLYDDAVNMLTEVGELRDADANLYSQLAGFYDQLKEFNEQLWVAEDSIRIKEKNQEFDSEFILLARSVYETNDKRAEIKKEINIYTKSSLIEEKSYEDYSQ